MSTIHGNTYSSKPGLEARALSWQDLRRALRRALKTTLWTVIITFPFIVLKDDTVNNEITWRWSGLLLMAVGGFSLTLLWYVFREWRGVSGREFRLPPLFERAGTEQNARRKTAMVILVVFMLAYPFLFNLYNTSIMITALIYVILGLGLNIIIGWGGLLNLGYAAFFSAGAYTYALLYKYAGIGFWLALPLGGLVAAILGVLVSFPVLRLRGDYLAIVTLGFGEIIRLVLNNAGEVTGGPDGISQIPRPDIFGQALALRPAFILTYFAAFLATVLTIWIMRRIENSRWGRAWEAMREDEIAARAMGVNITRAKLTTFALGSFFAGIAGVILAAKTTKVTPDSFGLLESFIVLCIVVLGGMGSIPGVVIGALILKLLPEYFRAFSSYRMLVFGLVLVIMMVFKPDGLIPKVRNVFRIQGTHKSPAPAPTPASDPAPAPDPDPAIKAADRGEKKQ